MQEIGHKLVAQLGIRPGEATISSKSINGTENLMVTYYASASPFLKKKIKNFEGFPVRYVKGTPPLIGKF